MKANIGLVQHHFRGGFTVVQRDEKCTRGSHNQLVAFLVRVCSTVHAHGDVVDVKHPFDLEGKPVIAFYNHQIAYPRVVLFQGDHRAILE